MENALIAYTKEQQHRQALAESVVANRRAVDLSRLLYQNGQTNFLNVLIAERSLFAAETSLVQSNTTLATNLVALYKALGRRVGAERRPAAGPRRRCCPTLNVPDLLKLPQ